VTDCITYVRNVLKYSYEQAGKPEVGKHARRLMEGFPLANYLVLNGWSAHYWNADVRHPRDGSPEHPFSYQQAVKTGKYYGLPLSGFVVNYNRVAPTATTPNTDAVYQRLGKVRFAYGIARGGKHTFLYSYGMVFEVHWDKIGAELYGRTPRYDYEWRSGVLVTPPGEPFFSDPR
jgi:hypothetical protein